MATDSSEEAQKSKMVQLADEVKKESLRVKNTDDLVKECIENNILSGTQKLMQDCGLTIATGEEMCRSVAEGMQELNKALGDSQSVIRRWKNKLKHKGILSGGRSDQGKILAQLHKMDKNLTSIIDVCNQAGIGAQQISEAATDATTLTQMSVDDVTATLKEIYLDEKSKFAARAKTILENIDKQLTLSRESTQEVRGKAEEATTACESLSQETADIKQALQEVETRAGRCQELVDLIESQIDEVKDLGESIDALAQMIDSSLEETEDMFNKLEGIGLKIEESGTEVQSLKDEAFRNAVIVVDKYNEERQTKLSALEEAQKTLSEAEKLGQTMEEYQSKGKQGLAEAEEEYKNSGIDNPDVKRLLKEAALGKTKLENLARGVTDPVKKATTEFEKMKALVDKKKSTLKEINRVANLVSTEKKKAKKAFDEGKPVYIKMNKAIQESKDKTVAMLMKDEVWAVITSLEESLTPVKEKATQIADSIKEFRNLANIIHKDRDDSSALVADIEQSCEKMENMQEEAFKAINGVEEGIAKLKKIKADRGTKKAVQTQIKNSQKLVVEAEEKVEKSATLVQDYGTVLERARVIAKNQHSVDQTEKWATEAETMTEEGRSFIEELAKELERMRSEIKDCEDIKEAAPPKEETDEKSKGLENTAIKCEDVCKKHVESLEELLETSSTLASDIRQAYDDRSAAQKIDELFLQAETNFDSLKTNYDEAKAAAEELKRCVSEVIASLDIYKAHRDLLTVAKEAKDKLEKLRETTEEATITRDEGKDLIKDLDKLDIDVDQLREDLKKANEKSEAASDKSSKAFSKNRDDLAEELTDVLDASLSVEETSEKIKFFKEKAQEMDELDKEINAILEECNEVCERAKITVRQSRRKTSIVSAVDIVRIAKQIAEDCMNIAEDAGKASEMAAKAADECGRDTLEARKVIDNAMEAARIAQEAYDEAVKAYEEGKYLIQDIEMMMRQERFTGEKISEVSKSVDKSITRMHEANKKATEAAKVAYNVVDDVQEVNPKNWDSFKFFGSSDEADDELLCIIRAPKGVLDALYVTCSTDNSIRDSGFSGKELPFSHVIKVEPQTFDLEEPALVSIPYDMYQRSRDREILVKSTSDGEKWQTIPTSTTERVFEDYRGRMFAEIMVTKFSTYFVVSRMIKETVKLGKKGVTLSPSSERRVTVIYPPGSIKQPTNLSLEVQSIESNAIPSMKERHYDDTKDLDTSSPMLHFNYSSRPEFAKPVVIRVPLTLNVPPQKSSGASRPKTAAAGKLGGSGTPRGSSGVRPLSAAPPRPSQAEEFIPRIMCKNEGEQWKELTGKSVKMAFLRNDIIEFKLEKPVDKLFLISTISSGNCLVPKMASMLEAWTQTSLINVLLHQHEKQKDRIIVQLAHQDQTEVIDERLMDRGFEGGISNEIEIVEGQHVRLHFTGNLHIVGSEESVIVFHRGLPNRIEFTIKESNPYRNFSSENHVGTAQFHVNEGTEPNEEKWNFLTKFSVNIPKLECGPQRPKSSFRTTVKVQGALSEESLRHLSQRVGEDFEALATQLGFNRPKIQRIKRESPDKVEQQVFHLLISWRNAERRLKDKVSVLCDTFRRIGRHDLIDFMYEIE